MRPVRYPRRGEINLIQLGRTGDLYDGGRDRKGDPYEAIRSDSMTGSAGFHLDGNSWVSGLGQGNSYPELFAGLGKRPRPDPDPDSETRFFPAIEIPIFLSPFNIQSRSVEA